LRAIGWKRSAVEREQPAGVSERERLGADPDGALVGMVFLAAAIPMKRVAPPEAPVLERDKARGLPSRSAMAVNSW
jgi:hypothetical protein